MRGTALGHRLETLNDGLTTFANGERAPMPLVATDIHVQVLAGAAQVTTTRRFRNAERVPIEAIMTFPVGFDAVVTGLSATIDGRRMVGVAQEKSEARETYETALDEGRLSVLHEEALRGIHILSVGALPPGAEVSVELEQMVPMTEVGGKQFLRLPMTAGQLYGNSPLLPADDMMTSDAVRHEATLRVITEEGHVFLDGKALAQQDTTVILLNRAVELVIEGGSFGILQGRAADGRAVAMTFKPTHGHDAALDLHVLVDRSGSTGGHVGGGKVSIWQAMRDGLGDVLRTMRPSDRISLWQFDNACQFLGTARGEACSKLVGKLQEPAGGTELSGAVRAAIAGGAKDLLVLTDGQTWAHIVDELNGEAVRISAILVGAGSLDANVGHLCAMTGGQVFYAPGQDVSSPLRSALGTLRTPSAAFVGKVGENGPEHVTVLRGGITIEANWAADDKSQEARPTNATGRFAAALAIPLLDAKAGEEWARAHSLCTHSTSLVLVDEAGEVTEGFSQTRKVANMPAITSGAASSAKPEILARMRDKVSDPGHVSYSMRRSDAWYSEDTPSFSLNALINRMTGKSNGQPRPATPQQPPSLSALNRLRDAILKEAKEPVEVTFQAFEWNRNGDALLSGDLSSLNTAQQRAVRRIVEALQDLSTINASTIDDDALIIHALGLIARRMGDRLAARFARRALNGAPDWVIEHRA
jgi:hypothetical protein